MNHYPPLQCELWNISTKNSILERLQHRVDRSHPYLGTQWFFLMGFKSIFLRYHSHSLSQMCALETFFFCVKCTVKIRCQFFIFILDFICHMKKVVTRVKGFLYPTHRQYSLYHFICGSEYSNDRLFDCQSSVKILNTGKWCWIILDQML